MIATEMPAAMRPYSMAVAPDSFFTKRTIRFFIDGSCYSLPCGSTPTLDRNPFEEVNLTVQSREHRGVLNMWLGDGKFNLVLITTTIPRLEDAAMEITRYVSDAVQLFSRIYNEQKLEG